MNITCTPAKMAARLVRYADLRPCTTAFIDTRTPGNQKENFTIIGPGVAENPDQHVHINIPHGFNVGAVRQEPHCVNSQHSHETAEVFIVQNSRWAFRWGVDAEAGEVEIGPGDVISIPTRMFRGFENIGDERGFMCAVLGGDDPGRVTWAPAVLETAKQHGLVLLEDGRLIDTAKGETVPADAKPMPPTTDEFIASMRAMSDEDMQGCIFKAADCKPRTGVGNGEGADAAAAANNRIARHEGVTETPVIGAESLAEGMPAGPMAWPHGFHLRRLDMTPGAVIKLHKRMEEEVIYMYDGTLDMQWEDGSLRLHQGDVLTIPVGLPRLYTNTAATTMTAYIIRGSDSPAAPVFE